MLSLISKKNEVEVFLNEVKDIINNDEFNIDKTFRFIKKSKPNDLEHSTKFTLIDLDYNDRDVVDRIKELTVKEYSETKLDRDDENPSFLFVFGKSINKKIVYIKLKIKNENSKYVLCVSFHYDADKMVFPYA